MSPGRVPRHYGGEAKHLGKIISISGASLGPSHPGFLLGNLPSAPGIVKGWIGGADTIELLGFL